MQHRRLRIVVEEEESSEDEFGLPRQLDLEMGSDGDADVEERSEGGEPDTEAAADEEEDRTPPECPQPQQGRRRTSAEFLAAVTIPGGDEEEGRGGDPLIRELRERGLPTSMPFGRYLGTSLRRMWETDHGKDYLLNFMGRTPAFYNRANTLRNRDLFMRLLESLHTLGYVTEVTDIHGRKVRAAAVLRAYCRDRLNALESSGPVPKPLPERTPIRHNSRAGDAETTKRQRRLAPPTSAPASPTLTPTASTTSTAAASAAAAAAAAASPACSFGSASHASSSLGGRGVLSTPPPVPPGRLPPRAPLERHRAQSLFR